ncbi:uncharacterized protein LOC133517407 [Cydia pomonella]|uniref:uncharacterized protein LOC133517407 n=1 Tax=Cydia pomonella TaxID=82600 RepID=UPI002ADD81A8|nr:uncharacterized protein LOC133517407 [Cydia pomonella]
MFALRYFIYLCLFPASKIDGYRTIGANIIVAEAGESVDIACESEVPLVGCEFIHPGEADLLVFYNAAVESCKVTVNATPANSGLWTCVFYTSSSSQPQVPQPHKMVELRVLGIDKENTGREGDSATLSYESSHEDIAPISAAPDREVAVRKGDSATLFYESSRGDEIDDEPIVISVQTYVCANLAFLATFVALLYCKERYYTRYYGTRWDDDDSMHEAKAGDVKCSANPLVLVV